MGVMLLMLTPLLYMDLSSSWAMRSRWQRMLVGGAGMLADLADLADLAVGAMATLVWSVSPPGMVNELAYDRMFTTDIYTVVFNINHLGGTRGGSPRGQLGGSRGRAVGCSATSVEVSRESRPP